MTTLDDTLPISLRDGIYRLAQTVHSPLPRRLTQGRRRKGWALQSMWRENDRFVVENHRIKPVDSYSRAGRLGPKQIRAVIDAIAHELRTVPTLPSDIATTRVCDSAEILDALFSLGRISLDDVRDADHVLQAASALGNLSELHVEPPAPATAAPTPALVGLRVGDVVYDRISTDPDYYTVLQVLQSDMYLWQRTAANATAFTAPWDRHREPVFGHVGDLIAEGLVALAPSEPVGVDRYGKAVHCGDVLVSQNGEMRVRVVGRADPLYGESAALYVHLAGPPIDVNSIALGSQNKWAIERPETAPPPAPVRHGNFGKPAPETHDPFSLD